MDIPFAMHEAEMARQERLQKRLIAIIIILLLLLTGTNIGWIVYESQFEKAVTTTTQSVEQDAENGENHFIGGDYNGFAEDNNNDNNENP